MGIRNMAQLAALGNYDADNFKVASEPGGIERQEAEGQRSFVASETLPANCPREQLEKLGFVFGNASDDLFTAAQFPEGWSKKATDHSMWSDLLDGQGRKRGSIFYKAAFYDRKAHMRLERRYVVTAEFLDAEDKLHDWRLSGEPASRRPVVRDNATGLSVYAGVPVPDRDYPGQEREHDKAAAWLAREYKDHEDVLAYW